MRVAGGAAAVAIAGLAVALVTGEVAALSALVVMPLAAANLASARATALVAALALALAALSGLPHGVFGAPHAAALIAVALAGAMATFLASERTRRERSAAFQSFLGDASALLSCSLDFDETAKTVASVAVPELADWCLVEVTAPDGTIERRAASHPDEAAEDLAAALTEAGGDPARPRMELWHEITDDLLAAWAGDDAERLARLHGTGVHAAMRVPLRSLDRRLGIMTLVSSSSAREFDEDDLRRAEDLAARCAVAIENAQLYRAARRSERRFGRRVAEPGSPGAAGRVDPPRSAE
jgi:transcriptional regulator with GAF, ATPase, and Fis domain